MGTVGCVKEVTAPSCPLCRIEGEPLYTDLSDSLYQAAGKWNYIRCPHCDLVWLEPPPSFKDLTELYTKYYKRSAPNEGDSNFDFRKFIEEAILAGSFGYGKHVPQPLKRNLGWLFGVFSPLRNRIGRRIMFLDGHRRGRLLDIGCGTGWLLSLMRRLGWEVAGVEPSAEAAVVAQERFGLQVFIGALEEAMFKNDTFDAITMQHVFEHLTDPVGTLNECFRVLRPGGQIVIVTPNVESLAHKIFKRSWLEVAPPWHTYLWSPRALGSCIEKIGFTTVKCNTMIQFDRWIQSWIILKLHPSQEYVTSELQRIYPRWRFLANVGGLLGSSSKRLGDEIVISAKKGS